MARKRRYEQEAALNAMADRLENAAAAQGIRLAVRQVVVGTRWITFRCHKAISQQFKRLAAAADDLALALGVGVVNVKRGAGWVDVMLPREEPETVLWDASEIRRDLNGVGVAYLGVDHDGNPLGVDITADTVTHILVAGTTGSGKTVLMRGMIMSMALLSRPCDLGLLLIDPAQAGYRPFRGLPHLVRPVIADVPQALAALSWLVGLMEQRRQAKPRLVLFVDELADLCMVTRDAVTLLTRLLQRGRQAGIHVVAATQRPTAQVIGGLVKGNFPVRIVGNVASPEDAKIAAGVKGTGAERLLGRGDFLLIERSGNIVPFQSALITERQIIEQVRILRGGVPMRDDEGWPTSQQPEPELDLESGRGRGRPARPPTAEEIQVLRAYYAEHGEWPTSYWVRQRLGVSGRRAQRLLEAVREDGR